MGSCTGHRRALQGKGQPGPALHCRAEQGSVKTETVPRIVIARPQRGRGNLGKAVAFSPIAAPLSNRVLRDCHGREAPSQ